VTDKDLAEEAFFGGLGCVDEGNCAGRERGGHASPRAEVVREIGERGVRKSIAPVDVLVGPLLLPKLMNVLRPE
ncbi:MAG: hypothetical protein B7Z55_00630, partial [Planctomycetales bacterium 12-60-4]